MATIKGYTDLEQSRKLAKILPPESADMVYLRCDFEDEGEYSILVGSYHEGYTEREDGTIVPVFDEHIPCWSLAALFNILPNGTDIVKEEADTENEHYMCTVGVKDDIISTFGDNPVDACVNMILKLKERNLL